jgi:hypothetical protein
MKGKVNIQLFDKNGNLKKDITKENMITNALDKILNPDFPPYWGRHAYPKNVYDSYTPIVNRLIGGVLLFNNDRTEDVNHILPTLEDFNSYTGSAGGTFTGKTSKVKGSLNLNESTTLDNGYKFVWDFPTGKSFNLKSLSLTSLDGGNIGLDFDNTLDTTTKGTVLKKYNYPIDGSNNNGFYTNNRLTNIPNLNTDTYGYPIYISNDFKIMYLGKIDSNNVLTITKFTYRDTIKINDNLATNTSDITDLNTITNWEKGQISTVSPTLQFDDIHRIIYDDNYIYSCKTNGSGNTMTLQFIRIDIQDLSYIEKTITFNTEMTLNNSFERYYLIQDNKLIINDYYSRDGDGYIYIVDVDTDSLIKYIYYNHSYNTWQTIQKLNDDIVFVFEVDDIQQIKLINLNTGETKHQRMVADSGGVCSTINPISFLENSPVFTYKNGGGWQEVNVGIYTCYFVSIFNLDEMISKNEDDTLKITYTITNE